MGASEEETKQGFVIAPSERPYRSEAKIWLRSLAI
jgi:hypothetical protein